MADVDDNELIPFQLSLQPSASAILSIVVIYIYMPITIDLIPIALTNTNSYCSVVNENEQYEHFSCWSLGRVPEKPSTQLASAAHS